MKNAVALLLFCVTALPAQACFISAGKFGAELQDGMLDHWSVEKDEQLSFSSTSLRCTFRVKGTRFRLMDALVRDGIAEASADIYAELKTEIDEVTYTSYSLGKNKTDADYKILAFGVTGGDQPDEILSQVLLRRAIISGHCWGPPEQALSVLKKIADRSAEELCLQ